MQLSKAINNFLSYCEHEKKLSPHSVRAYKIDLNHFCVAAEGDSKLCELTASAIEACAQRWLRDPALKTSTVKRRVACIKSMVRWLFRRRIISVNPLESLDLKIRLPKKLPKNLQTTEIKRLLEADPNSLSLPDNKSRSRLVQRKHWDNLTARLAIEVMTLTGMRVGELTKVSRTHIDLALQQIRIQGKGNRERQVSFPDSITMMRLETYHNQALSHFGPLAHQALFVNSLGHPANEQYIRRIVRSYAQTAQLQRHITPHMLRHTAATQLLEAGVDMRFVQRVLGHASITTTEIYTHVSDQALRMEICRANVRERLETH